MYPEEISVQYCDGHCEKLGILVIFTESSDINPKKFLF